MRSLHLWMPLILFSLILCSIPSMLSLGGICLDVLLESACELAVLSYLEDSILVTSSCSLRLKGLT